MECEQGFWLLLILLVPKRLFPKRQQTDKPGLPGLHTRTRTSPKAPRRYDFTNDGGEKHIVSICASNDFFDHSIKPPFYVLFIYWWRIQYRREAIFCATGFCNIPRKWSNPVASPNKKLYENVWRSDQDTPASSEKKWWNLFVEKVICGQVSQFLFHFRLSELIYIYISPLFEGTAFKKPEMFTQFELEIIQPKSKFWTLGAQFHLVSWFKTAELGATSWPT